MEDGCSISKTGCKGKKVNTYFSSLPFEVKDWHQFSLKPSIVKGLNNSMVLNVNESQHNAPFIDFTISSMSDSPARIF